MLLRKVADRLGRAHAPAAALRVGSGPGRWDRDPCPVSDTGWAVDTADERAIALLPEKVYITFTG
ncbi:hypothetical protein QA802_17835 [Streptomyces sp. B21-105]|uniref:hypothetical protein n=1 Tax=Streptomyces sp. B21-105 TaxID=3039417 RepID=UPI002FF352EB